MNPYSVQIADRALADMQEIYDYIAGTLLAPETAMGQYNRIADAIESLDHVPGRCRLFECERDAD
jgi:plasmid stabilization system protein ParE